MAPRHHLPVLLALACALFLRVLVPAGWMPAPSSGAFAIEPCPAADAASMAMSADNYGHKNSGKDQHSSDCAFAPFHAGLAHASEPASLASPALATAATYRADWPPFLATGPPALPPPSTGPPALA